MSLFVDVHLVQTVPPSCINRDDTGTPKTAMFGGKRRLRVSSQAWKRATRKEFQLEGGLMGLRSQRILEAVADAVLQKKPDFEGDAYDAAAKVFEQSGVKLTTSKKSGLPVPPFLVFLSKVQIDRLADLVLQDEDPAKKQAKQVLSEEHSIDLALFGRMVAGATDLNVDASCQVAHALSTHAVDVEVDYFTAVDDMFSSEDGDQVGAGMIGTVDFAAATLYRYATINVDQLIKNLGGDTDVALKAVSEFVRAFVVSMPTGKQNTFANRTRPEFVLVDVREDQPVSYVGAFEEPARLGDKGYLAQSVEKLLKFRSKSDEAYGSAPAVSFESGLEFEGVTRDGYVTFPALLEGLTEAVSERVK